MINPKASDLKELSFNFECVKPEEAINLEGLTNFLRIGGSYSYMLNCFMLRIDCGLKAIRK